jgi:saccharopine dehydrogenase (NAD+, L-lysine forming)
VVKAPEALVISWRGRQLRVRHDDPHLVPYTSLGATIRNAIELASDVEGLRLLMMTAAGDHWTTIEECLNPPIVWEKERGFFTLPPFAEPERFVFPEGIGPVECVHVEHEDVTMIPRVLDARRVTFKFALGEEFIGALKVLHAIGLDRTDPITVDGQQVRPRNVVAALLPDPATLGDNMSGRAVVGTHVTGIKDGRPREIFSYQMCDAQDTMRRFGLQPVAWQTGFNPVVAMELLAEGAWQGAGVLSAESFDPDPYLAILDRDGIQHATIEIEPGRAVA